MNIRRFTARDMRTALREVRDMLGPNAVMLSSRQIDEGVEVMAAMDYEGGVPAAGGALAYLQTAGMDADAGSSGAGANEDLSFDDIAQRVRSDAHTLGLGDSLAGVGVGAGAGAGTEQSAGAQRLAGTSDPLSSELRDLRRLLETQLAGLAWNDMNRTQPARARMLRQYAQLGIDTELARELAAASSASKDLRDASSKHLTVLASRIPLLRQELAQTRRIVAVVGPTGVGKTTSIAKIAARFVLQGRSHELGLVSMDSFRIGAREQMLTFARILGVPMHTVENADQLRSVLDSLAQKKLVLIDTAGMGQRDLRLAQQFGALQVAGHEIHTVLALSAASDRGALTETLRAFRAVDPAALIVTKLDEATTLGPILSLSIRNALPIAYLSDGQRVPEDFHLAGPRLMWLMQNAIQLARQFSPTRDEDELALEFGGLELAANG